jgi:hypothetical protein
MFLIEEVCGEAFRVKKKGGVYFERALVVVTK